MVNVRPLAAQDAAAWRKLFADYAQFYRVQQTEPMRDLVWSWLMDPAHPVKGLAAQRDGALIGFAHYRPFARALSASTGGYLDDLFVLPGARGSGAGRALIAALTDIGRANGWSVLRWITDQTNQPARALYDKVATQTPWVTYDIDL